MSTRKIINHSLDAEKTLPYFFSNINCGKAVSKKVCEKIDFTKGSFFTLLPDNALLERLYNFEWGIIPSIPYGDKTYMIKGRSEPFHPTQVITMDRECAEFIAHFLGEGYENWMMIEDYMSDPQNLRINLENVKMSPYGSDVYYLLHENNSLDEIYLTLRVSTEIWHSLIVLTQLKNGMHPTLTDSTIDQICENVRHVIVRAYDGDGYIFWQANK